MGKELSIKDGNGNEITNATNIGQLNSFRYRSYYHDDEVGMYYLSDRYYDPAVCRMLNADAYMNGNANMMENNMFGYASNNPVTYYDPLGSIVDTAIDVVSIGWSAYDLYKNPSWGNLGYLAWDVAAAAVPFVPGSYVASLIQDLGISEEVSLLTIKSLPDNAQKSFNKYSKDGWNGNVPGQSVGTKAGSTFKNKDGKLPSIDASGKGITYKEYDVNNKVAGQNRDAERFVRGSDGSVYYTNDHYGNFTKIK